MHDSGRLLFLLLLGAGVAIVVLSWRAGLHRKAAQENQAAREREDDRRSAARARSLRAVEGEGEAAELLGRYGYTVIDRQVAGSWTVRANGEAATFGLRADYLVTREGQRFIAEVKTGRLAPRLSHGPTRRQLLEYAAAFDVDGVILVDADTSGIMRVDLDPRSRPSGATARPPGPHGRVASVVVAVLVSFSMGVLVGASVR